MDVRGSFNRCTPSTTPLQTFLAFLVLSSFSVDCSSQLSSALVPYCPFPPQLAITQVILLTILLFRHIRSCSSTNPNDIVSLASEGAPQEYHIIEVADEAVRMQSTSSSGSIVHKIAEPFLTVVASSEVRDVSPSSPSPPVSNGHPSSGGSSTRARPRASLQM